MKKFAFLGLLLLVFASVSAQNRPVINIINSTGYEIYYAFVSPSSSDNWGSDVLGADIIRRNSSFIYSLPDSLSRNNVYDIMLEDDEGDYYIKWQVRVSDNARIVFTLDDLIDDFYSPPVTVAPQPAPQPVPQPTPQPAPQPQPVTPQPVPVPQTSESSVRTAIVNAAQRYLGARYVYGSQSPPSRFDCSGLVNQAYRDAANIAIPRSSSEIWARGKRINARDLMPGDIIVYSENGRTPSHVAIYVDNTYMIHSVSIGNPTGVVRSRQTDGSWPRKVLGYVTFVGIPGTVSRSSKQLAVTNFPVDITGTFRLTTESLPVQSGSALEFELTNSTGSSGEFSVYFYRDGISRTEGETETFRIINDQSITTRSFMCGEPGKYRLEVIRASDHRMLFEYNFIAED